MEEKQKKLETLIAEAPPELVRYIRRLEQELSELQEKNDKLRDEIWSNAIEADELDRW